MADGYEQVRTERLLLRRPVAGDLDALLRLHRAPEAIRHNPTDALLDEADARRRLAAWDGQWAAGLGYWTVVELADDGIAGFCGVKAVELHGRPVWNLLYRLDPQRWGRGIAREAAAASLDAARQVDARRPVIARVRPENVASARVARAIGLVRRPDLDLMGDDGPDEVWSTASTPGSQARIS
jgi:ribosomal-protein-alanine N-acetyltransferase